MHQRIRVELGWRSSSKWTRGGWRARWGPSIGRRCLPIAVISGVGIVLGVEAASPHPQGEGARPREYQVHFQVGGVPSQEPHARIPTGEGAESLGSRFRGTLIHKKHRRARSKSLLRGCLCASSARTFCGAVVRHGGTTGEEEEDVGRYSRAWEAGQARKGES